MAKIRTRIAGTKASRRAAPPAAQRSALLHNLLRFKETFSRAVPACVLHWWSQRTWYQSVAWIEVKAPGGAGPGSQETRSHDLSVLSVQLPVRVPQRRYRHLLGQESLQKVSVQERISNISRAWPDVSHLIKAEVANSGPESEKPASLPPFTCQWCRSTCGSSQTVAGLPSCCLESPLLGGARSSTCLQRWPRIRAQQHAGNTYVFVASLPPSQPEKWTIFALKVARNKSSLLVMQLLILDAMNNKSFPLVQTPRPTGRPLHR
ncbi:uncharacterized protein [Syngnathus scovelli]|uniref:uncharacterized protein n=1 Tax=Syngnathus scovelli TaxID=161590 RepID=UPI0035CB1E48